MMQGLRKKSEKKSATLSNPNTVEAESESFGTGENTCAVMCLCRSSKFVGVASISFCFAFY